MPVKALKQINPQRRRQYLYHRHNSYCPETVKFLINQRYLKVRDSIDKKKRQDLRTNQIDSFQISDLKPAVCMQKKEQDTAVQRYHQPVSSSPEGIFKNSVIITVPNIPVNSCLQAYHSKRGKKSNQTLIWFILLHSTVLSLAFSLLPHTLFYLLRQTP